MYMWNIKQATQLTKQTNCFEFVQISELSARSSHRIETLNDFKPVLIR